jgi:RNA polymerase sigma factor (sigma-70 family)
MRPTAALSWFEMDSRATSLRPEQLLEHVEWVRRLARRLVTEATAADDVAQQTLLTAIERPPARADHPRAWLATVARSVARRWRRATESRFVHESRAPTARGEAAAAEVVERANTQRAVVDAVLDLEEPYRSTILMRYFEDLTPDEAAARLEVPVETIRTRLKRGIAQLRGRLETKFGGERAWLAALIHLARLAPPEGAAVASATKAAEAAGSADVAAPISGGVITVVTTFKLLIAGAVIVLAGIVVWKVSAGDRGIRRESEVASNGNRANPAAAAARRPGAEESVLPAANATRAPDPPPTNESVATGVAAPSLHGVIRDVNGAPVANAAVFVADEAPDDFNDWLCQWEEHLLFARATRAPSHELSTVTNRDGSYAFTQPLHDGTWNVAAIDERGLAWRSDVEIEVANAATSVDLVLEPGLVLSGTVTDEAGLPVTDAQVVVSCVLRRIGDSGTVTQSLSPTATDDHGRYRTPPTPFRDVFVEAHKRGYYGSETASLRLAPGVLDQVVDLKIEAGRIVSGRLFDRGGRAAALASRSLDDLAVLSTKDDPEHLGSRPRDHGPVGSIDVKGDRYELAPMARDARFVAVYRRELLLGAAEIPPAGDGPDVQLDFDRLPKPDPTGTFSIVVTDAATHAPIRDYAVIYQRPRFGTSGRRARDDVGRHRSERIPLGRYRVSVHAEGYAVATTPIEVSESEDAAPTKIELVRADSSISGVVLDGDRAPLPRAKVYLCDAEGEPVLSWTGDGVEADSRGRFEYAALAHGTYVVLAVVDAPFGEPSTMLAPASARVALSGGEAKVELRLSPGITVKLLATGRGLDSTSFCYRIRDDRGAWVVDCYRGGGVASISGACPRDFLVAPGHYLAEIHADHFRTGRAEFLATPDLVVPVEMVPDDR